MEITANENTGKLLYIQQYYIQLSHHVPHVCLINCVGKYIFYGVI